MFQDVILVGIAFDFINLIFYNLLNSFQADSLTDILLKMQALITDV